MKKLACQILTLITLCVLIASGCTSAQIDKFAAAYSDAASLSAQYQKAEPYEQYEDIWPMLVNTSNRINELERKHR